jgi:uncharacterized protein (TIGR02118 family)
MAARMVVIYNTPKDTVAFDKHYHEVHVPLAHLSHDMPLMRHRYRSGRKEP